ncbi:MAG: ABC transporter ATP-binding protein [Atopobiaceae bacterium]|nr:ABC transporter ATP-binding protein [Atopobiaceae bacterium]
MRLSNISKSFGSLEVLRDFSVELPTSGFVGISGPSGRGKTTLIRIIAGLERPDAGTIEGCPGRISMQFEEDRLLPWLDVCANLTLVGATEADARVVLAELGLEDKLHARVSGLSGGQRRRVALARSLLFPAQLYLLDEPTARLDEASAQQVIDLIWQRCSAAEKLVVISSHDSLVLERCNTVIEL